MRITLFLFFLFFSVFNSYGQNPPDSLSNNKNEVSADDPSQFITRIELFNELQHHKDESSDFYFNQSTFRSIIKIGNRFTTRLDVPYVYNNISTKADYKQSGIGDISFRLLGYQLFQSNTSLVTGSIECSFNTAASPLLGTGKNLVIPVVSYTRKFIKQKMLMAIVFQQTNSFSGDEDRSDISFSKVQALVLNFWSVKMWTVLGPEWYFDYIHGGVSMNLKARFAYAPVKRVNIWVQPGAGIFGDFIARYQWNIEVGYRYFFMKSKKYNGGKSKE